MSFRDFYLKKTQKEREEYAARVGLKTSYIYTHLASDPPRKSPPLKTIKRLADASDKALTFDELTRYFLPEIDRLAS